MSPVEFWCTHRYSRIPEEADIEHVYGMPKPSKILLVESQEEYDYCWAMQMVMGAELNIQIMDRDRTPASYLDHFVRVFTTWDPSDRNRI